ncbi:hypothetical protein AUR64_04365 [Haloprofundus marisrubri]|uniref:Uncharacterized protein n=1 Tax=Haloprofundus marisrubri TaxID=1514971 RepID=A0A0W1RFP9_9EURY|nr:hypothetical protein [Haloprofundus marisrubri]KTG11492.1 hypothetical protein AUR64_04365 [Haloprofundus marisrubri]
MLVCDTYSQDDLPNEFTYGTLLSPEEAYLIIEDGDERFLLRTGWTGHGGFFAIPLHFLIRWLTLLPLAVIIALGTREPESRRTHKLALGLGLVVCVLGFLAPYIEMIGLVSALQLGLLLLCAVWLLLLIRGGYRLYQKVAPMV